MMKRFAIAMGLALLAVTAHADVVHLKNGKQIEGEVVKREGGMVTVKTKFGTTELKESEVDRVEIRMSPKDEFAKRSAEVDKKDTAALMELYAWAKGEELKNEATRVLRDVIKADPDHASARKLLGYVEVDGKWLSEAQAKKANAAAERAQMEAKGMVQYKGDWVTPEEKETLEHEARGEVLVGGEWVNKRDFEKAKKAAAARAEAAEHRAKGEYLVDGKWLPKAAAEAIYRNIQTPYIVYGDNVRMATNRGIDFGDKMIVSADAAYRRAHQFFGKKPDGLMQVFFVNSIEDYNELGANVLNADIKSSNFYAFCSPWLPDNPMEIDLASATFFYKDDSIAEIYLAHAVAEQFVTRLIGPDATDVPPRWFIDGVASYIERWQPDNLTEWSRNRLRGVGGSMKLKSFFGSYPSTEQSVLLGGLLVHFLKNPGSPEELRTLFNDCVIAVNDGGKVSKAFRKLEKALIADEDVFYDYSQL